MKSFKIISSFNNGKRIVTMDEAQEFTNLLEERFAVHGTVIKGLSDGFRWDLWPQLQTDFSRIWKFESKILLIFLEKGGSDLFIAKISFIIRKND